MLYGQNVQLCNQEMNFCLQLNEEFDLEFDFDLFWNLSLSKRSSEKLRIRESKKKVRVDICSTHLHQAVFKVQTLTMQ